MLKCDQFQKYWENGLWPFFFFCSISVFQFLRWSLRSGLPTKASHLKPLSLCLRWHSGNGLAQTSRSSGSAKPSKTRTEEWGPSWPAWSQTHPACLTQPTFPPICCSCAVYLGKPHDWEAAGSFHMCFSGIFFIQSFFKKKNKKKPCFKSGRVLLFVSSKEALRVLSAYDLSVYDLFCVQFSFLFVHFSSHASSGSLLLRVQSALPGCLGYVSFQPFFHVCI